MVRPKKILSGIDVRCITLEPYIFGPILTRRLGPFEYRGYSHADAFPTVQGRSQDRGRAVARITDGWVSKIGPKVVEMVASD